MGRDSCYSFLACSCAVLSGCLPLRDKGLGCTHRLGVLGQQVGRVEGLDPFPLPRYHPCCLTHTLLGLDAQRMGQAVSVHRGGSCLSAGAQEATDSAHRFPSPSSTGPSSVYTGTDSGFPILRAGDHHFSGQR